MMRVSLVASAAVFLVFAGRASANTTSCNTVSACLMATNSASGPGVSGRSESGYGVSGVSSSSHGIDGRSDSSFGVFGVTTGHGGSSKTTRSGVLGEDLSTDKHTVDSGVVGLSTYGFGGFFASAHGIGLTATGAAINGPTTTIVGSADGLDVTPSGGLYFNRGNTSHAAIRLFANQNVYSVGDNFLVGSRCLADPSAPIPTCGDVFSVDSNGNAIFNGNITQDGTPLFRTRRTVGPDVASFGARAASPLLEDVGKAELRRGEAYVALDGTFASAIALDAAYSVFITPEGDSNSLYTTRLTRSGFVVRESKGGRSSLTFDYRIVARPLGTNPMHLPAMSSFPQLAKHVSLPANLSALHPGTT